MVSGRSHPSRADRRWPLPRPGALELSFDAKHVPGDAAPVIPASEQLQEILQMTRRLIGMRKAITPQRDMTLAIYRRFAQLPGITEDDEPYFCNIHGSVEGAANDSFDEAFAGWSEPD